MKQLIYIYFPLVILLGCSSQDSLQKYMAKNSENPNFLAIDLSSNILNIDSEKLSEDEKEMFNSIKKLNVLLFRKRDNNEIYNKEKEELQNIINKNSEYEKLIQANTKGKKITFYSLGSQDTVDEIVLLASDDDIGFAVIRLLGKKINPENMMNFMSIIEKADIGDELNLFFDSM